MKEFITYYGTDPLKTGFASLCSIAGFLLSIGIILLTLRVNSKVNKKIKIQSDINDFNKHRDKYRTELIAYQSLIQKDGFFTPEISLKIHNIIEDIGNHNSMLKIVDKVHIILLKRNLSDYKKVNLYKVGRKLSYFISRCNKKEDHYYE